MTEFKVGDRVKVVNDAFTEANNGHTGTIKAISGAPVWPISVTFDDNDEGMTGDSFGAIELELIEPTPRAYTLADLRAHAVWLRNARDEILDRTEGLTDQAKTLADQSLALERAAVYLEQNS